MTNLNAYLASELTSEEAGVDFSLWRKEIPYEFSTSEYREARALTPWSLGASDAGTVMGTNKWCSPYTLFRKLRKEFVEEISDEKAEIFQRGHDWEEPIANQLLSDLRKVYGDENVFMDIDKHTYLCSDRDESGRLRYPWMVVNLDALYYIYDEEKDCWKKVLGEIKTTGSRNFDTHREWREGKVPPSYEWQVRYMMKALDIDEAYIMCAWGFDRNDRAYVHIERDPFKELQLMMTCQQFVDMLDMDCPPDQASPDIADANSSPDDVSPIDVRYEDTLRRIWDIEDRLGAARIKLGRLELEKEEALAELAPALLVDGNYMYAFPNGDRAFIKVKEGRKRGCVDAEKLKKEKPDVYESCKEENLSTKKLKAFDKKAGTSYYSDYWKKGELTAVKTYDVKCYEASE